MGARVGQYELGTRAGKYKLGARAGGQGPSKGPEVWKYKYPIPYFNTYWCVLF